MRSDCIDAITRAAGRALTAPELRGIEGRLLGAARANMRENRQTMAAKSPAEQMQAAAERVAKELAAEKSRQTRNVAKQIIATDRNLKFVEDFGPKVGGALNAVRRLIADNLDRKANVRTLEARRDGIARTAIGQLADVVRATQKWGGFWADKGSVRDVLRELYGEDSGNQGAKAAAEKWSQVAESLRTQSNEAGSAIKKRSDWAVPQSHSQAKVAKAGFDQWLSDTLPGQRRDEFVNDDGSLMTDAQLLPVMQHVFDSISTDGANQIEPGKQTGAGALKNRHQDERVLHFKDADSWMDYQQKYGERSLLDTMTGHVHQMAKQIATMETFGPNAEAGFRTVLDTAYQRDAAARRKTLGDVQSDKMQTQVQFDISSGKAGAMADPSLARKFDLARTLLILPKLGSATLSAITDGANIRMIARANRIPMIQAWQYALKSWGSADFRQTMRDNGVGVEQVTHGLSRWGEEVFGHGSASVLANTLFRVSGLNMLDSIRRTAGGAMMMRKFGDLVSQHDTMDTLHPLDKQLLESRGVDSSTWNVWKQAELSDGLLTPNAIQRIEGVNSAARRNALQHLVGSVFMDEGTVVPMMKDWARATTQKRLGQPTRGTVGGEIVNSILQFKSFPIAMISNHWQRLMAQPTPAGKALYAAELIATSTILGAISVQLKSLASGHDPQDMTDPKFAARSFIQGGSSGLYGDLIGNAIVSPYREKLTDALGPLASTLGDVYSLGQSAVSAYKDPNKVDQLGGEATRFAKGLTPFSNLWYTKAMTDHLIFQRLQDYFSPGYNERSDARSQKFYGSAPYWPTSSASEVPSARAPNLRSAIGEPQ